MALTKKFFCPVNGWDCPYWKKDGSCSMIDEGLDPVEECDDAYTFWCDEDHEDYFVWEDDEGNRYDKQELFEQGYLFINGEPVKPLSAEIDRIKSELADIGAKTMHGKTCAEMAKDIVNKVLAE